MEKMMMWENTNPAKLDSTHYSIMRLKGDGMAALRAMFPDGEADDLNAVLFSTSGVHGSYCKIEEVEADADRDQVTFVVIHPRTVCMRYGNASPKTPDDFAYLKKLRASSLLALAGIGLPTSS